VTNFHNGDMNFHVKITLQIDGEILRELKREAAIQGQDSARVG
jgi:hypothetical protein